MAEQLQHKYELLFGQPLSFYGRTDEFPNLTNPTPLLSTITAQTINPEDIDFFVNTKDAKALKLTNHQITFDVSKTKESGKETRIVVYNISDNVRKYLEAKAGDNPAIILYAGYETDEELKLIFQGEVIKVKDTFMGNTRVTEILCTSGFRNLKEAYSVRSFRAGTSFKEIITTTIKDLKLPQGTLYIPKDLDIIIDKPVIINGKTKDFLDDLAKQAGFKLFIEDGTVNLIPDNFVLRDGRFVFEISAALGNMIGSPVLLDDEQVKQEKQATNKSSLMVNTTLNGGYQIGNFVSIVSKFYTGVYEITAITHKGNFEGSDWMSTLEVKPIEDWEVRR